MLKTAEQNEKHSIQRSELAIGTVTSVKFLCNYCVYSYALSCTVLAFRHAMETHLGLKWQTKTKKESRLFSERGLGFETAGSGTLTWDLRLRRTLPL